MALYPTKNLRIGNSGYQITVRIINPEYDSFLLSISKLVYAFAVIKCLIDDQRASLLIFIGEMNRGSCTVFYRSIYSAGFRVCGILSAVNAYRRCTLEVIKICICFCDCIRSCYHIFERLLTARHLCISKCLRHAWIRSGDSKCDKSFLCCSKSSRCIESLGNFQISFLAGIFIRERLFCRLISGSVPMNL